MMEIRCPECGPRGKMKVGNDIATCTRCRDSWKLN